MHSNYRTLAVLCFLFCALPFCVGQEGSDCIGWTGDTIVPDNEFYDASGWIANASAGNECSVTANDTSVDLHWKIQSGQDQWVQCYLVLDEPVSLSSYDIFRFDLHGSACISEYPCHKQHVVEIKFEDGSRQAVFTRLGEDGILCVDRWIDGLFFHLYDDDFSIPQDFDWDHVSKISFGVRSHPWVGEPAADSGVFSFRNLRADSTGIWAIPPAPEILTIPADTLTIIKQNALELILSRQTGTGLLTTWNEDGLSWLYGQGLALKILSLESEWDEQNNPVNDYAEAAQDLARFLADHQEELGYWPRAWNSFSGDHVVLYEDDGSIWMGDFPWALTGLGSYFKRSGDSSVLPALCKGADFLKSLIDADGKFYTLHVPSATRIPVTSTEAYAAAIGALLELGENELADKLIADIHTSTWDTNLLYWKEGVYSDRIVLFANTWLSLVLSERGYEQESLGGLRLAGTLLYTCGPGEPCGLDGIGPIATWYEGTLSYIAAGGCGSNILFHTIRPYINNDGSVPHYNDSIGSTAGIWAETWASLDGTSWLYFVTAQISPFEILNSGGDIECITLNTEALQTKHQFILCPNPCSEYLDVCFESLPAGINSYTLLNALGEVLFAGEIQGGMTKYRIQTSDLIPGLYSVSITNSNGTFTRGFIKQ